MRSPSQSPTCHRRLSIEATPIRFSRDLVFPDLDDLLLYDPAENQSNSSSAEDNEDDLRGEEHCVTNVKTVLVTKDVLVARSFRQETCTRLVNADQPSGDKKWWILLFLLLGFALPLLGAIVRLTARSNSPALDRHAFSKEFVELRHLFPGQKESLWLALSATLKSAFVNPDTSTQPSVILIFNDQNSLETLNHLLYEFYKRVRRTVSDQYGKPVAISSINCSSPTYSDQKDGALALNDHLHVAFAKENVKVKVLLDAQKLPVGATRTLHAFCDTTSAPYKDVVIVLTVSCPFDIKDNPSYNTLLSKCLFNRWLRDGLPEERYASLLSRIGAHMTFVLPEHS